MKTDEPMMLSAYLRTKNGQAVLEKLKEMLAEFGAKPAKETGYEYALLNEAVYFIVGECAEAEPGSEEFDMEVDEGLFEEDPETVVATVLGHVLHDDCNCDLLGCGDARYDELCALWRDYAGVNG